MNSRFSINWHTRGESPNVYVSGNGGESIWVTIKYGEQDITLFMPDEWHGISLADDILRAIKQYRKHRRRKWAREILSNPVLSQNELYRSIAEDALVYQMTVWLMVAITKILEKMPPMLAD